jgi:RimJ/RimL family protein N-acetyltransferase
MGSTFWGTGLFVEAAEAVVDFAFRGVDVVELGARAVIENGRGNGALRKLGAVCEGLVPAGHVKDGRVLDQFYWTLSTDAPIRRKVIWEARDLHE